MIEGMVDKFNRQHNRLMRRKEQYLKAWLACTGLSPEECMLIIAEDKNPTLNFSNSKILFLAPLDVIKKAEAISNLQKQAELKAKREAALSKLSEEDKTVLGIL